MRKLFKLIIEFLIFSIILIIGYWVYFYSGLEQILIDLILINIFVYIVRTVSIGLLNAIIKSRIVRFSFALVVNIIWLVFIFSLLFLISPTLTIAIISFLLVAISLTFSDIISNIASGIILVSKEDIEIGDLIETNNTQGIVKEINLNYTVIKELDGVLTYIPNQNVYNASVTKFTHTQLNQLLLSKNKKDIKKHLKEFQKILRRGKKITNYTKVVEILSTIDPEQLDSLVSPIFDKYEPLLGIRPDYLVDTTTFDRLRIVLLVMANSPELVLEYLDLLLRDLLYQLYPDEIFEGWDSNRKNKSTLENSNGGGL
ncbi:MAG: mechanosensitive ion channel domain-containing protein [Candidatus Hermodarchaeota archaeon]